MMRSIVCVLMGGLVLAVRKNPRPLGVEKFGVIDHISALVEKNENQASVNIVKSLMKLKSVVGHSDISGELTTLIASLENKNPSGESDGGILGDVKKYHEDTRTAVGDLCSANKNALDGVNTAKGNAESALITASQCQRQTSSETTQYGKTVKYWEWFATTNDKYSIMRTAETISDTTTAQELTCTLSNYGDTCATEISQFNSSVDQEVTDLSTNVGNGEQAWESAKQDWLDAKGERDTYASEYSTKAAECNGYVDTFTDVKVPDYESAANQYCCDWTKYNDAKSKVNGVGTGWSDTDRLQEWKTVREVVCLLKLLKDDIDGTDVSYENCADNGWLSAEEQQDLNAAFRADLDVDQIVFNCTYLNVDFNATADCPSEQDLKNESTYFYDKLGTESVPSIDRYVVKDAILAAAVAAETCTAASVPSE